MKKAKPRKRSTPPKKQPQPARQQPRKVLRYGTIAAVPDTAAAEWVHPDALTPWPDNPRKITPEAVRAVIASITRFGFAAPIVARRDGGEIIAGHTRYQAARELGLVLVPVRYLDLSADEARKLALADNRLGELVEWEMPGLHALLTACDEATAELLGWSPGQLADMTAALEPAADGEWDDAMGAVPTGDGTGMQIMTFVVSDEQAVDVKAALHAVDPDVKVGNNKNRNGNALATIAAFYNREHG